MKCAVVPGFKIRMGLYPTRPPGKKEAAPFAYAAISAAKY